MATTTRLTPTLFDKLTADTELSGLHGDPDDAARLSRETMRYYSVPRLERFNEAALRATIRRDLAWLLNTTSLGASASLDRYPHVATSVLNYGVPDLAGKSLQRRTILQRAREIRSAIRAFEPRLDPASLMVEPVEPGENSKTVGFLIHGDITGAVHRMPVKIRTEIEPDSAAVTVAE